MRTWVGYSLLLLGLSAAAMTCLRVERVPTVKAGTEAEAAAAERHAYSEKIAANYT
jgi:hypothetical protein